MPFFTAKASSLPFSSLSFYITVYWFHNYLGLLIVYLFHIALLLFIQVHYTSTTVCFSYCCPFISPFPHLCKKLSSLSKLYLYLYHALLLCVIKLQFFCCLHFHQIFFSRVRLLIESAFYYFDFYFSNLCRYLYTQTPLTR